MDATDIGGFEGNESQQGQGLAYVLPQSRSVGYFMQLANEKAQQRRDDAAALAAQQQKANEQYANHLYQFKTPEIATEYSKWLQPQYDNLIQSAADYHAKTGQDPFVNADFIQRTNDLNQIARNTHDANLAHTAYATQLADKSKNFTNESKQAGIDYLNAYQKDPVGNLYTTPPQLQQRDLDLNDAIKLGHATPMVTQAGGYTITAPNTHNHVVQGQQILGQPEFAPLLQKQYGINTNVGDAFGQPNGKGGTIYPTDAPTVNSIADHVLQNAAQPHYAQTLQAAGIDPADPHAKDKLVDLATRQNMGYGKALTDFSSRLDANVENKKELTYKPNEPDRFYEHWDYESKHPHLTATERDGKVSNAVEPVQDFQVPYNTASGDGSFNLHVKNFVPLATASKEFAGTPDIDVANGGQPTGVSTSVQGKIAGVGDFPVYKNGIKTDNVDIKAGTPASEKAVNAGLATYRRMVLIEDKDGNHHLVDYNKLPANTKNSKPIREALGIFDQTPVGGDSPSVQPQATGSSVNPVNKHKKAATDYGL